MLSKWAGVSTRHAHVLLARKDGKTLSHAFIEVDGGERSVRDILLECRHKVLGSGKRARRVTITRSTPDELMREVRKRPFLHTQGVH